jgi:hypothetical protein
LPLIARLILALTALTATFVAPAAAAAVEKEGTGENVKHVRNIAYPNLNAPDETNAGTDLEFVTLTVSRGEAVQALKEAAAPPAAIGQVVAAQPASKASKGKARAKAKPRKRATCAKAKRRVAKAKGRKKKAKARKALTRCRKAAKAKRRSTAKSRSKATARAASADARPAEDGLQRTFAIAGSYGDGLHVVDVTDPENATLVSTWNCGVSQGDVQIFSRDGRTFATFTHDSGYTMHTKSKCFEDLEAKGYKPKLAAQENKGATFIVELTDPYNPKSVSMIAFDQPSHNMTVHPSGRYMYNSNSDLITSVLPAVEIVDINDVTKPKQIGEIALKTFPGLGTESHDITFSKDGKRAYVAALSHGEILDTTDPANPSSIGTIVDPSLTVWHQSDPITIKDPILGERTFLVAEDEVAGALGTGQCPNGGVHVYDITGELEQAPVKVGYWNIDEVRPTSDGVGTVVDDGGTCTAHVFQLFEKEQIMTIAYYNGGVRVVDLTGLVGVALGKTGVGMKQLGFYRFPDSNTWAVKAPSASRNGFYMYGNDHRRGFDVYKYTPAQQPTSLGVWRTPAQTLEAFKALKANGGGGVAALCLIDLGRDRQS